MLITTLEQFLLVENREVRTFQTVLFTWHVYRCSNCNICIKCSHAELPVNWLSMYQINSYKVQNCALRNQKHCMVIITSIKMFLNKNHVSRVGEKSTQTRGLVSDIPTYNTVHFYNPTSLQAHYCTLTMIIRGSLLE